MLTFDKYLSVKPEHYQECLGKLSHSISCSPDLSAELRFHYVLSDGDGEPKFQHLAEMLVAYIVNYCFTARKFQGASPYALSRLFMQARDLFRKYEHSGQAGEVLIYFLLEAVLSALQVLQKMPITTNPSDERKGSDGLHAKWNDELQLLDVFISESKLYNDFPAALNDAFVSMERFHATPMRKHEYWLATHNMSLLDPAAQEILSDFFEGKPGTKMRTNHACLIGFDWDEYLCLDDTRRAAFLTEFLSRYAIKAQGIAERTMCKISSSSIRHLRFEFFFVPFKSVEDFRLWFNAALTG